MIGNDINDEAQNNRPFVKIYKLMMFGIKRVNLL